MIFVPSFHKKCHDLGIHMSSFNEIKHGNILFLKIIVLDSNDFIYKLQNYFLTECSFSSILWRVRSSDHGQRGNGRKTHRNDGAAGDEGKKKKKQRKKEKKQCRRFLNEITVVGHRINVLTGNAIQTSIGRPYTVYFRNGTASLNELTGKTLLSVQPNISV